MLKQLTINCIYLKCLKIPFRATIELCALPQTNSQQIKSLAPFIYPTQAN